MLRNVLSSFNYTRTQNLALSKATFWLGTRLLIGLHKMHVAHGPSIQGTYPILKGKGKVTPLQARLWPRGG